MPGNGTTSNGIQYSFEDNDLFAGRIFYRLKQLDFNGEFEYSSEILVEVLNLTDYQLFQNYPNPFNPNTSIKYSVPVQSKIKITLYDIIGNEVSTLFDGIQQSGAHEINLTADNLPSGVYFVSMTAENFSRAIKITLMK
ncbi:MAG: T9SS type A sorting domain-containing protein [Bacteroidetes bacterium]|nr:T9SS type A sorting domain-containing protein [Bacteroidota bacterium]